MRNVIRETKARKERPFWLIVVIVFAAVLAVNFLITLCNMLGEKYAGIASIFILIVSLVLCCMIVMKLFSSYIYTLDGDRFVVEKKIGSRSNIILNVDLNEVESIKPYKDIKSDIKVDYTYKLVCSKEYNKFYYGEFTRNDKRYRFVFKPSDRLINIIKSTVNQKDDSALS